jgi:hypothetical protein
MVSLSYGENRTPVALLIFHDAVVFKMWSFFLGHAVEVRRLPFEAFSVR